MELRGRDGGPDCPEGFFVTHGLRFDLIKHLIEHFWSNFVKVESSSMFSDDVERHHLWIRLRRTFFFLAVACSQAAEDSLAAHALE